MHRLQKGFTFIELMIALVVFAIVIGVALPAFNGMVMRQKSVGLSEDLVAEFNLARSEAVKRSARVSICASANGTTCGGAWNEGFITVVDRAATDNAAAPELTNTANPTALILRTWTPSDIRSEITPEWLANATSTSGTATTFIRFTSLGTLGRIGTNSLIRVTTQIEGCEGDAARTIDISLSGSTAVRDSECE